MGQDVSRLRADAQAARDELRAWRLTTPKHVETADALLEEADALAEAGDADGARARLLRVTQLVDDGLAEAVLRALLGRPSFRLGA